MPRPLSTSLADETRYGLGLGGPRVWMGTFLPLIGFEHMLHRFGNERADHYTTHTEFLFLVYIILFNVRYLSVVATLYMVTYHVKVSCPGTLSFK